MRKKLNIEYSRLAGILWGFCALAVLSQCKKNAVERPQAVVVAAGTDLYKEEGSKEPHCKAAGLVYDSTSNTCKAAATPSDVDLKGGTGTSGSTLGSSPILGNTGIGGLGHQNPYNTGALGGVNNNSYSAGGWPSFGPPAGMMNPGGMSTGTFSPWQNNTNNGLPQNNGAPQNSGVFSPGNYDPNVGVSQPAPGGEPAAPPVLGQALDPVTGGVVTVPAIAVGRVTPDVRPGTFQPAALVQFPPQAARITKISAGIGHTCALDGNGAVWCWGFNGNGQLGVGGNLGSSNVPVKVLLPGADPKRPGIARAISITSGSNHSCAVLERPVEHADIATRSNFKSNVLCWGDNRSGQLGVGGILASPTPVPIKLEKAVSIEGGAEHTCAVGNGGSTLFCWGSNKYGQLGIGLGPQQLAGSPTPRQAFDVNQTAGAGYVITGLTVGTSHSCLLFALRHQAHNPLSELAYCFGRDNTGQIGHKESGWQQGNITHLARVFAKYANASAPDKLVDVKFTKISAGGNHTCALTNIVNQPIWCWGSNYYGQLGGRMDYLPFATRPLVSMAGKPFPNSNRKLTYLSSGLFHICAAGTNFDGKDEKNNGDVKVACWGGNEKGQVFNSAALPVSHEPVVVLNAGRGAHVTLASGGVHSCALLQRGFGGNRQEVYCWGSNRQGQLGRK